MVRGAVWMRVRSKPLRNDTTSWPYCKFFGLPPWRATARDNSQGFSRCATIPLLTVGLDLQGIAPRSLVTGDRRPCEASLQRLASQSQSNKKETDDKNGKDSQGTDQ
jgi:hypothetical protein